MKENMIRTVISIISVFILIAGISATLSSCAEEVATTIQEAQEETSSEENFSEEITAE